jgi:hypothetical protein
MTTTVAIFIPSLHPGKHVRVRSINPADGTPLPGEQWHTAPNIVKTFTLTDGAALEIAEVESPAAVVVEPTPTPATTTPPPAGA